jgi:hypothetical protein
LNGRSAHGVTLNCYQILFDLRHRIAIMYQQRLVFQEQGFLQVTRRLGDSSVIPFPSANSTTDPVTLYTP